MSTTVISIGPFRDVHDIDVFTDKGRRFTIDIYKNNGGFESEVTVIDRVSNPPGSWIYQTTPASSSAIDNFEEGIKLIKKYLSQVDPVDSITDVHNPCNCPFVGDSDQNAVLSKQGVRVTVRVN